MVIDSDGLVGIGTTTPTSMLTVSTGNTNTTLTSYQGSPGIAIINPNSTDNNFSPLDFRTANSSGTTISTSLIAGIHTSHTASSESGDLAFLTRNSGTLSEKMRITAAGLLGVGTTTPSKTLSVQGDALISGNLNVANLT